MTTRTMTQEDLQSLLRECQLHARLGLEISSNADAQDLTMKMPFSPDIERSPGSGQFHGGSIATLIDTAGDFALIRQLGFGVPTIQLAVEYLRPASGSHLLAHAMVRRAGRTVGFVDVEVHDEQGRLVALGRGCYGTQRG